MWFMWLCKGRGDRDATDNVGMTPRERLSIALKLVALYINSFFSWIIIVAHTLVGPPGVQRSCSRRDRRTSQDGAGAHPSFWAST